MRRKDGLLDPCSFAYLLHASDQAVRVGSPLAAAVAAAARRVDGLRGRRESEQQRVGRLGFYGFFRFGDERDWAGRRGGGGLDKWVAL